MTVLTTYSVIECGHEHHKTPSPAHACITSCSPISLRWEHYVSPAVVASLKEKGHNLDQLAYGLSAVQESNEWMEWRFRGGQGNETAQQQWAHHVSDRR